MATSAPILPEGYTFHSTGPSLPSYLALRRSSPTLTPITATQAEPALAGSWYALHVTHADDPGTAVAMGRVISDGGWYFVVADVVVLPAHQRKGLGEFVMAQLMREIRARAPRGAPGAHVTLSAAPGARGLYARHGFKDTMPANMGMGQWLEKE